MSDGRRELSHRPQGGTLPPLLNDRSLLPQCCFFQLLQGRSKEIGMGGFIRFVVHQQYKPSGQGVRSRRWPVFVWMVLADPRPEGDLCLMHLQCPCQLQWHQQPRAGQLTHPRWSAWRLQQALIPAGLSQRSSYSLFIFAEESGFRMVCHKTVTHRGFDMAVVVLIVLSSVLLTVQNPWRPVEGTFGKLLNALDYCFTGLFCIEAAMKVTQWPCLLALC